MERDILFQIKEFNKGRNDDLLKMKYQGMKKNIYKFYRGTAHLFYKDLYRNKYLKNSPIVWACGDLHFENFGSYKGDNGLVYFDINDFDEASLSPCLFDISRFLISLFLIAEMNEFSHQEGLRLCKSFIESYTEALLTGNSRWVEKQTAKGVVKKLLEHVETRKPLYKLYTNKVNEIRAFDFNHRKLLPTTIAEKNEILEIIRNWHLSTKAKNIYHIHDIAYHIKGSGSLGIKRYILLVQKKVDSSYALVDLKMSTPSCSASFFKQIKQPYWNNEAERTVEVQKRVQGTSQALLESIQTSQESFVLREYQSHEDKIKFQLFKGNFPELQKVVDQMALVTAWGQLQSTGRQGSCITDELIQFANDKNIWQEKVLKTVMKYFKQVKIDYNNFCVQF